MIPWRPCVPVVGQGHHLYSLAAIVRAGQGKGRCPAQPSDVGSGSAVGLPWLPAHLTHPSQHILKLPFRAALRHSPSSSIPGSPAHSRGQVQPGQSETAALTKWDGATCLFHLQAASMALSDLRSQGSDSPSPDLPLDSPTCEMGYQMWGREMRCVSSPWWMCHLM